MKVLLLLLLCILTLAFFGVNTEDVVSYTPREEQCFKEFDATTDKILYAYFSEHYIGFSNEFNRVNFKEKFLSICLCRKTFNQTFFVFPYLYNHTVFEDAIVFCMYNTDKYQSLGIYDDYELFDTMLFNRMVSVPSSVVDPMGNDEHRENESNETVCYDWFGLPTKNVLGQRTCLLAVDISLEGKYIYSGPLLGNAMVTFSNSTISHRGKNVTFHTLLERHCFTTTNDSLSFDEEDRCFYEFSKTNTKFQCCCAHSPEKCSPKYIPKKLFCVPGKFDDSGILEIRGSLSMKEYTEKYVSSACSMIIGVSKLPGGYNISVSFNANATCADEIIVSEAKYFCSSNLTFPHTLNRTRCCNDEHFCNLRLVPKYFEHSLVYVDHSQCYYRYPHVGFMTNQSKCEFFVDIKHDKQVQILLDYNAIQPKQMKHFTNNSGTEHYYAYLQIIKADPFECEKKLLTNAKEYRPFIHAYCNTDNCDKNPKYRLPPNSTFETLEPTIITNDTAAYPLKYVQSPGWICYVEIKSDEKGSTVIQAGELTDFANHLECLENDVMKEDGTFCCLHIFFLDQIDTGCTVGKMIKKHKEESQYTIINGKSRNGNKYYTRCFIRDLPHDSCLSEAGCFETRLLNYSKNSDAIEPAGCISNAEKYVSQNLPLSSLSLGCRSEENSNKCSVIQTPDGQQRILCCCNGEECKNNLRDLPNQIGKKIASFRGSQ